MNGSLCGSKGALCNCCLRSCVSKWRGYMLIRPSWIVAFVKAGNKKKKISKAERLRQLQEEEERRLKEEGKTRTVFVNRYC